MCGSFVLTGSHDEDATSLNGTISEVVFDEQVRRECWTVADGWKRRKQVRMRNGMAEAAFNAYRPSLALNP